MRGGGNGDDAGIELVEEVAQVRESANTKLAFDMLEALRARIVDADELGL